MEYRDFMLVLEASDAQDAFLVSSRICVHTSQETLSSTPQSVKSIVKFIVGIPVVALGSAGRLSSRILSTSIRESISTRSIKEVHIWGVVY